MMKSLSVLLAALMLALSAPLLTHAAHGAVSGAVIVQSSVIPMSRAVEAARRAHPGSQVLDARLVNGSSPYYVVRVLTREGRRLDVRVDARTGRVIG